MSTQLERRPNPMVVVHRSHYPPPKFYLISSLTVCRIAFTGLSAWRPEVRLLVEGDVPQHGYAEFVWTATSRMPNPMRTNKTPTSIAMPAKPKATTDVKSDARKNDAD